MGIGRGGFEKVSSPCVSVIVGIDGSARGTNGKECCDTIVYKKSMLLLDVVSRASYAYS